MSLMDFPSDVLLEEQLALDVANLRQSPDWERLMEDGTTPAMVVGGERRQNPR
jgi:hypothetical protein